MKDENIVKAFEYAKNKYVVLDEEDLENLQKENEDKAVEIIDFVKLEEIDPIYFEKTYFLSPDTFLVFQWPLNKVLGFLSLLIVVTIIQN